MKKYILIILVSMSVISCYMFRPPNQIKYVLANCSNGSNTGIDSLLNINGYYTNYRFDGATMVLYSDGKVAFADVPLDAYRDIIESKKYSEDEFSEYFHIGNYVLNERKLVVRYVIFPTIHSPWVHSELVFLIKDNNTLELEFLTTTIDGEETKSSVDELLDYNKYSKFKFEQNDFLPNMKFPKRYKNSTICEDLKH